MKDIYKYDLVLGTQSVSVMEQSSTNHTVVRSDVTLKVIVNDPLYQPIVHRYLDHLIHNLRAALRGINFANITNVNPQVGDGVLKNEISVKCLIRSVSCVKVLVVVTIYVY